MLHHSLLPMLWLLAFLGGVSADLKKWEATSFCKCICFGANYTILHLDITDTPAQPCLSCTKQWCLNQNLVGCSGATLGDADPEAMGTDSGDVEARCFQRDSPRDQLIVTVFLLVVFGLLLGAGIKSRMLKAGFDPSVSMDAGRRFWDDWTPRVQDMRLSRFREGWGRYRDREEGEEYTPMVDR
ncbi:hypothetical protein CYLTODRAFT_369002 [Cylindrobasidium torrendii FP15055 ss-10]|uniref:Transmembrane protein n=1 Tax=Cylindrobasidium torrendii FP15055 ss-10 TaxID=1314674 RepID=A0A0D7BN85_9AGAR|nr:hypothetical protein CYLTODRAFT_369002 [Cylindrobasidium torrendii FP15055 ss-10]